MTWIAIDCDLFDHPKMVDLPSDAARYGWLVTLSKAKRQRNAGTFASSKHFAHVLGRYGRYVKDYIKAGLLELGDDGTLTIHDWRKHQWAASKARLREDDEGNSGGLNEDTGETSSGHSEDSRARNAVLSSLSVDVVTSGVGSGAGGRTRPDPIVAYGVGTGDPEWPAMVWLSEHRVPITEGGGLHRKLIRLCEKHGAQTVIRSMAALGDKLEANQYVLGADNALNPIPSAPRLSPKDQKAQSIADLKAEAQRRLAEQKAATA